jgi:hypothetical protein
MTWQTKLATRVAVIRVAAETVPVAVAEKAMEAANRAVAEAKAVAVVKVVVAVAVAAALAEVVASQADANAISQENFAYWFRSSEKDSMSSTSSH